MIILKIAAITAIVLIILFVLTLIIYFFNLDMKLAASLIKPLTAYYIQPFLCSIIPAAFPFAFLYAFFFCFPTSYNKL